MKDDKIKIKFGHIILNGSDFKTDTKKEYENIKKTPLGPAVEYSWDLTGEQAQAFQKIILKKYGENIKRCLDCQHCIIEIDDQAYFKDIKCGLGAGKLTMISNSVCILQKGG